MVYKIHWILLLSIMGLLIISGLFIYSSSIDIEGIQISNEFTRQLVFIIFGVVLFVIAHFLPFKYITDYKYIYYIGVILLLIITLFFGQVINGAKSWLGVFGFGIQVSEFTKIISIILLSSLLSEKKPRLDMYRNIVRYALVFIVPMVLILLQPDMGTALSYIPILLGIYLVYGVSAYRIVFIVSVGIVSILTLIIAYYFNTYAFSSEVSEALFHSKNYAIYLGVLLVLIALTVIGIQTNYFKRVFVGCTYILSIIISGSGLAYIATIVLKPYQMKRLLIFVNPEADALGSGWHILRSKASIGAGGLRGEGFLQGIQTKLDFLPQKSTDFIFSVIGEEWGFLGTMLVIVLYIALIWSIIMIGSKQSDLFSMLYCTGVAMMFFVHFMVNVGMTIGVMPITGIPLLLISYGGSSLWTSLIAVSIVHQIHFNNYTGLNR